MDDKAYQFYIVVTQSGSILSKALKVVTRAPYNHVSVSLEPDLDTMYSFGRIYPYNPVLGGFVKESPHRGTFARFDKTQALVLRLDISEKQFKGLARHLEVMYNRRHIYKYDVIGLFLAAFHISYKRKNMYYCSDFVKEMLIRHKVVNKRWFKKITKPIHFTELEGAEVIYTGRLKDFAPARN